MDWRFLPAPTNHLFRASAYESVLAKVLILCRVVNVGTVLDRLLPVAVGAFLSVSAAGYAAHCSAAPAKPVYKPILNLAEVEEARRLSEDNLVKPDEVTDPIALPGLSGHIRYPFLIRNNFLTCAAHMCGSAAQVDGRPMSDLVVLNLKNEGGSSLEGLNVRAELTGFSTAAIDTVTIAPGESAEIKLTPTLADDLMKLVEQRPGSIHITITQSNGTVLFEKTRPLTLLSRNDIIWRSPSLVGVFITPNDRRIDELVSYAAEKITRRTISGYYGSTAMVEQEVKALYDTISELGIHYRSSTESFMDAKELSPQRTYYPAESLEGEGANCLDGTLLFASALENIGLHVWLVKGPSHIFIAVSLSPEDSEWRFVETTMVGTKSFELACEAGHQRFLEWYGAHSLQIIEVPELRKSGIKPFPLDVASQGFSLKDKLGLNATKIFDIEALEAYVHPREFNAVIPQGTPPHIVLTASLNKEEVLNTSAMQYLVFQKNALYPAFPAHGAKVRIALHKADTVTFALSQLGADADDQPTLVPLHTWEGHWNDFVAKDFEMRSPEGSFLKLQVTEVH